MDVLNWGVLGTARINAQIIDVLHSSSRTRVLGIASRTLERAVDCADRWHVPRAYGDYMSLLADPEVDVIYNSLPNSLHASWTIEAAAHGKHVLCEKPLAVSVEEVDDIIAAAQRYGVVICEALMYRHHPLVLKLKDAVDRGSIGPLAIVRGAFSFHLRNDFDIRLRADLGGGSLYDSGCYPVSLARYLVGCEPREVFGWRSVGGKGVDVSFAGQMLFSKGCASVYAQFDCGFQGPYRRGIEIVGSDGVIQVPNPYKPRISEFAILNDLGRVREVVRIESAIGSPYRREIEDMADVVSGASEPLVSLHDSRCNVATMVSLQESALLGRPVTMNEG